MSAPHPNNYVKLSAEQAKEALLNWAKDEVSSVSTVRFDVAKFFFTATTVAIAFFAAAWKMLFPTASLSAPIVLSIGILCLGAAFNIYLFWPVIKRLEASSDIQSLHNDLVKELQAGIIISALFWFGGVAVGLYALLSQ